jgi:cytoplasmic iron level regulating protein YaaA (DUF328/UPF0246 family)
MLFLLPPSETKSAGGGSLTIQQVALTFGGLNAARESVYKALEAVCRKPKVAAQILKLSPKQLDQIQVNLDVQTAPTMRALDRYTGTLYDAIHQGNDDQPLTADAWVRAKQCLLIQSSLFGLIPATDLIPNYRLSSSTKLPKIELKKVWQEAHKPILRRLDQGLIVDLRSKAYAELAPLPDDIEHVWVEVVSRESDGQLRALNHFNKRAKGLLIRAILLWEKQPQTISDLAEIAASVGMDLYLDEETGHLMLVTDQIVKAKR